MVATLAFCVYAEKKINLAGNRFSIRFGLSRTHHQKHTYKRATKRRFADRQIYVLTLCHVSYYVRIWPRIDYFEFVFIVFL